VTADDAGHDWRTRSFADLLAEHGLSGLPEHDFPTDGWSGARFTTIVRPGDPPERFVIKRTSPSIDWIAAATDDTTIREARMASAGPGASPILPYLGAAADGEEAAILMPDLSTALLAWERPAHDAGEIDSGVVEQVVDRLAGLHAEQWATPAFPWCPLPERLTLTARPTCAGHVARGIPAGVESAGKLLAGWDAFDRQAPLAARDLVAVLSSAPAPLAVALGRLPSALLHGDLKLANVAIGPDDEQIRFIDWQMTLRAPVAVELGWFLVANSASLPMRPDEVLERYRRSAGLVAAARSSPPSAGAVDLLGEWDAQVDLARIVGLLLRGWRKGLDTEAGATLGSGVSGRDDLAEWSALAVEAAARRL
jgi:hypothetical protein